MGPLDRMGFCPNCGNRVVPSENGECPSCRKVSALDRYEKFTERTAKQSEVAVSESNNLAEDTLDRHHRRQKKPKYPRRPLYGALLFLIGLLLSVPGLAALSLIVSGKTFAGMDIGLVFAGTGLLAMFCGIRRMRGK